MTRIRQAAGGGRIVEVEPERLPGWVMRFADRHGGAGQRWVDADRGHLILDGADGAQATMAVPFRPVTANTAGEPIEELIAHIANLGDLAIILVRERAFSIGTARGGVINSSSTDTRYVQSRTAAGGWSQQRYARRRANQRRDSYRAAADTAHRVLEDHRGDFVGLVVGGDRTGIDAVLDDPRLARYRGLPRRTFTDIVEPRRAVLDEMARRALTVEITIVDATSET